MSHAKEVCRAILGRGLRLKWTGYFNPMFFDAELAQLLVRAGCREIEFGTDSGSPAMIASLRKTFEVEHLRKASALCHEHGIRFCHSLILGGPGESRATLQETFELMDEIRPAAVIAMTGIRVHPGTGMAEIAVQEGQLEAGNPLLFPHFYVSPSLGAILMQEVEAHAKARPHWILPGLGLSRNVEALQKLRERNVKGPLWGTLT
jgi:radical SAM superfamily enzyme YgiQ (UPF0313 family)